MRQTRDGPTRSMYTMSRAVCKDGPSSTVKSGIRMNSAAVSCVREPNAAACTSARPRCTPQMRMGFAIYQPHPASMSSTARRGDRLERSVTECRVRPRSRWTPLSMPHMLVCSAFLLGGGLELRSPDLVYSGADRFRLRCEVRWEFWSWMRVIESHMATWCASPWGLCICGSHW
jgi:hypothetical protein